jgi:hypothetical protein
MMPEGSVKVVPVIDHKVRALCLHEYPGHPKGCPNFGMRPDCPPMAPFFEEVYNMDAPFFAVVNSFDLGDHVDRMRAKHPGFSDRQLYCCLFWQPKARKQLRLKVAEMMKKVGWLGLTVEFNPEAMGVDLTATLADAGIALEWPPRKIACQVALFGTKK